MCRKLPQNLILFSFVKNENNSHPEIFHNKNPLESNPLKKLHWKFRKPNYQETNLKDKLLKNEKEKIMEFDKEKHLIKSFILANRKQEKEIDRGRKIIFDKNSLNSSTKSKRSYKMHSIHGSGKSMSMVPIEVS